MSATESGKGDAHGGFSLDCCLERLRIGRLLAAALAFALIGTVKLAAQPRRVLDMRFPGPGISRIVPDWGDNTGQTPTFIGDVNGDGFDDFAIRIPDPTGKTPSPHTSVIYGTQAFSSDTRLNDLRQTRIVNGKALAGSDGASGIYVANNDSALAPAGDMDGDAFTDFLLGSIYTDWEGHVDSGLALLVFGGPAWPAEVPLEDLAGHGIRALRFISTEESVTAGMAVALCGDLNADGKDDVAVSGTGAPGSLNGIAGGGRVYVIFGGFDFSRDIILSEVGGRVPGFVLHGAYGSDPPDGHNDGDRVGKCLSRAGDLDGDGFSDLLVGASGVSRNGLLNGGAVYVIHGGSTLSGNLFTARENSSVTEFLGTRTAGALAQSSVAGVGDVDGDGLMDFVVGSPGSGLINAPGQAYLIYGSGGWPRSARIDAPGIRSLRILGGETPSSSALRLGKSVAGIGDWDLDGFPDFIVTAPWQMIDFEPYVGAAFLVLGGPELPALASDADVGSAALPGIAILGARPFGQLGDHASTPGDFDADGMRDFLLTASFRQLRDRPIEEGSIYILHGGHALDPRFRVHAVKPEEGNVDGGYEVSILGQGFLGNETVRFGGTRAVPIRAISSAELAVTVPAGTATGAVDVEVSNAVGSVRLDGAFSYTARARFPDLALDDGTLAEGPHRTLMYRDFPFPRASLEQRGFACVFLGDLNGDGIDDLVIGAQEDGDFLVRQGQAMIVFGRHDLPRAIEPGETGEFGVVILGERDAQQFGISVAFPGDLDRDGHAELLLAAALDVPIRFPSPAGRSYILKGRTDWPPLLEMRSEVEAGRAIVIRNEGCGHAFGAVPGDIDGDGVVEILLGGNFCEGSQSRVLVLGGPAFDAPTAVITGDPALVVRENNPSLARTFGSAVSHTGDMNGDGAADFVVGADHVIGEAFLVLGRRDALPMTSSINDLLAAGSAVRVRREFALSEMGRVLGAAGDFNGDGLADALLGVSGGGTDFNGEVYVVFGSPDLGVTARDLDLRQAGSWRLQIDGEYPRDWSGSTSGIGDWNADGYDDIGIVSTSLRNPLARAYVVLGEPRPPERINLRHLGSKGFKIVGAEGNWFSGGVQGPIAGGDFDGDGLRDIAIGEGTPAGKRVVVIFGRSAQGDDFVRGDANSDGRIDLADAISLLQHLYMGAAAPQCPDAADTDDSGSLNLTDAIYLLGHLFLGGPPPPAPFAEPGLDPSADSLSCTQG